MQSLFFEWDEGKDWQNQLKHGVSFEQAKYAFFDRRRIFAEDERHARQEPRYYCFGYVGVGILTVRFTWREHRFRIFGAGYWRKGRQIYEKENSLHG